MPFQTSRKRTLRLSLQNKPIEIKENQNISFRTHEDILSALVNKDIEEGSIKISNLEVKYHYYVFYYRKLFFS